MPEYQNLPAVTIPEDALDICVHFLHSIGIKCVFTKFVGDSFLPGLSIEGGEIMIDRDKLINPGDILHEAGHMAVIPSAERKFINAESIAKREMKEAEEMMAIAWSYAACVHLKLHPYFVFNEKGYNGGGYYLADNFMQCQFIGLPMLQWIGLTADEKNAPILGVAPYPFMIQWLRD